MILSARQKISFIYLAGVPLLTALVGFGIGHVRYQIYIPIWIINSLVMIAASYTLGMYRLNSRNFEEDQHTFIAFLLFLPWVLFPIFAGMGPPPSTAAGWLATITEQQARYYLLIVGGVIAYFGFALLNQKLKVGKGRLYAQLGFSAMSIAVPLFVINMAFWGSFLSESFKLFSGAKRPEWYKPLRELFFSISIIEISLLYLSTALFTMGLKKTGYFSPQACNAYISISLAGCLLSLAPPAVPEPFATLSYLVSVPAIPFIMPYLIGINLLRINPMRKINGLEEN